MSVCCDSVDEEGEVRGESIRHLVLSVTFFKCVDDLLACKIIERRVRLEVSFDDGFFHCAFFPKGVVHA